MDGNGSAIGESEDFELYEGGGNCHTRGSKFPKNEGGQQAL